MAKTTKHSGASFTDEELLDPDLPVVVKRNLPYNPYRPLNRFEHGTLTRTGGESTSAGSNSGQSSSADSKSSKTRKHSRHGHAPTTESLSDQTLEDLASDVRSMGGSGPETETAFVEEELPAYSEMHKDDLKEECRQRDLPVSGTIPELIARLEEDDANQVDSDADEDE